MRSNINAQLVVFVFGTLLMILLSACTGSSASTPIVSTTAANAVGGSSSEVIVYASDLSPDALSELDIINDSSSPNGQLIGLPNNGDELDPPPENDPHATFTVEVQSGVPYRCWIHMKVGTPQGRSTANVVWVQFSGSFDQAKQEVFRPGTNSYLTVQGPEQQGWAWVGCGTGAESLVYFQTNSEVTVRIQAGAEGVGFDQFLLSSAKFLTTPPSEPIVKK